MSHKTVIITAGGIGNRMKSDIPKQFIELHGKTILEHTLLSFFKFDSKIQLILTLPKDWISFWNEICEKNNFLIPHEIVSGGKERYHSIKNALKIAQGDFIAIHDGVRPLVSMETIKNAFETAELKGNAIPVIPLKESIRFIENEDSKALNRSNYFIVQTPQVFEKNLINTAYKNEFHDKITDDASLVEEMGVKIHVFLGNEENIKITSPIDLKIAAISLSK
jgi:2-C-methyl-D-erythritol 4-phosphate cytidylyltransferase